MPRIRITQPADRTPGARRISKYMSQTTQPSPPLFQNLNRFFFLGALSSKETVPTTLTISSKETQRQTRKQQPSCSTSEFQVLDYTAIPIPTPEIGIRPTLAQVPSHSPDIDYPGSTLTLPTSTMPPAGSASTVHFSFVPAPTSATTMISLALSASASPSSPSSTLRSSISRTAITLLGIGAGCLALFVIILIKVCTRPRHRARLTPSLPILDEKYLGDLESQESPLFGGNERLSSKTDFNDLSSYASQPSSLLQPAQVAACDMGRLPNEYGVYSRLPRQQEKVSFPESLSVCNPRCSRLTYGLPRPPHSSTRQPPSQQVQDAIIQTMKRLSSVSFSLYPGSPNYEVGIAFGGHDTPLTGGGCLPVSRPKSKNYRTKNRRNRQSHGSAYDCAEQDAPSAIQYEHAAVASPPLVQGGRTRIKSSYYAHSRISLPMALSKARVDVLKVTAQDKENDTLGQASSLASPDSQGPAIDSAEESGEKEELHEVSDDQFKPAILLTPDPGATLGALLISEYHNEINRSEAKEEPRPYGGTPAPGLRFNGNGKKPSQECRTPDKPPRVPSPPPLPSLVQMAMEHRNQDDFENYRSPTYSIYGLYDGDGKSLY